MSYIKTEDGHVYDESKTVLSTLLGTRVIQVSDEIEPLLEDFIVKDGVGKTTVRIHFDEEECEYLYQRPNGTAWVGLGNGGWDTYVYRPSHIRKLETKEKGR